MAEAGTSLAAPSTDGGGDDDDYDDEDEDEDGNDDDYDYDSDQDYDDAEEADDNSVGVTNGHEHERQPFAIWAWGNLEGDILLRAIDIEIPHLLEDKSPRVSYTKLQKLWRLVPPQPNHLRRDKKPQGQSNGNSKATGTGKRRTAARKDAPPRTDFISKGH